MQIDSTPQDELLFYDALDGYGRFYRTDGSGSLTTIRNHSDWGRQWRAIVAGDFTNRDGEELLFYDAKKGELHVYGTNSNGTITLLHVNTGVGTRTSVLVPGEFSSASSNQEVMFYNPLDDQIRFFRFSNSGVATSFGLQENFGTHYTQIAAGGFPNGAKLAFYQPSPVDSYPSSTDGLPVTQLGSVSFYDVTDGALTLKRVDVGERRSYGRMVSGRFTTAGPGSTVLPKTSLIFYDRFRQ